MSSFYRLELPLLTYRPIKTLSFSMKSLFKPSFIMLYTGDFVLRYYVRFSHKLSHICSCCNLRLLWCVTLIMQLYANTTQHWSR